MMLLLGIFTPNNPPFTDAIVYLVPSIIYAAAAANYTVVHELDQASQPTDFWFRRCISMAHGAQPAQWSKQCALKHIICIMYCSIAVLHLHFIRDQDDEY